MYDLSPWTYRRRFAVTIADVFWFDIQLAREYGNLFFVEVILEDKLDKLEHIKACQDADRIIKRIIDNAS